MAKKSSVKTSDRPQRALVPQPHGGALLPGGTGAPGTGRPPSLVRERLVGSFAERVAVLEQIADGVPLEFAEIPLSAVLGYLICPQCDKPLVPKPEHVVEALILTVTGKRSARSGDRTKAMDVMAKYGLGTATDVSVENVRQRVQSTLDIIRQHVSPEQAVALFSALRPVWQ